MSGGPFDAFQKGFNLVFLSRINFPVAHIQKNMEIHDNVPFFSSLRRESLIYYKSHSA